MKANDDLISRSTLLDVGSARKIIEVIGNWDELSLKAKSACTRLGVAHKKMIMEAPAVDAAKIIRCEKCRYCFDGVCKNPKNRIAIKVPDFGEHYAYMAELKVPKDHYCGYAERKKQ